MDKWDIKDVFWRMDCREGDKWNYAYVLPEPEGKPDILVVPTSLQMGWDIATEYIEMPIGSLTTHKFEHYITGDREYKKLSINIGRPHPAPRYLTEVYVNDFMSVVIPVSQKQLRHVATAIIMGIHDVFPADSNDANDPIYETKLLN